MPIQPEPPNVLEQVTVLPAREAIARARPLPSAEDMAIEGITDDEWKAFEAALEGR